MIFKLLQKRCPKTIRMPCSILQDGEKVLVSKELVQQFEEINKALDKCCDSALQQPLPNKQIALMADASFAVAGYAVLIEDNPNQKFTSLRKSYAPVAYESKPFTPTQIKMSNYAKKFLAIYFAFKEFGLIFGVHLNRLLSSPTIKPLPNF